MIVAIFGRCSEIWMPLTLVAIGLNSPPFAVPGFMSKVSLCDGPPSIHRRMHDLVFDFVSAARAASGASQPDSDGASTPSDDRRRKSRREKEFNMAQAPVFSFPLPPCGGGLGWGETNIQLPVLPPTPTLPHKGGGRNRLMVQRKLAAVEQRPEDVGVGGVGRIGLGDIGGHLRHFIRAGRAR